VLGLEFLVGFRAGTSFIFGLGAATQDYYEQKINNWLLYSFIVFGLLLNLLTGNLVGAIITGGTAFGFGLLAWNFGFWGGGDAKYFTGIAVMLGYLHLAVAVLVLTYFLVSCYVGFNVIRSKVQNWFVDLGVFLFAANMIVLLWASIYV
jgi:Flp pilus assembly protein protease CpaA